MKSFAIILLIIVILRFLFDYQHVIFLTRIKNKLLKGKVVSKYEIRLRRLFSKAGITETTLFYTNFNAYGKDIIGCTVKSIQEYLHRAFQAFNPLYWIEIIIFLPKHIISYFGGQANSIFCKIIMLIYWLVTGYTTLFRAEIRDYILEFFK